MVQKNNRKMLIKAGTIQLGQLDNFSFKNNKDITTNTFELKKNFVSRNTPTLGVSKTTQNLSPAQVQVYLPKIDENPRTPSRIKLSPMGKDIFNKITLKHENQDTT